jgi:AbrB family looped-hinge helix DNA binding protein
LETTTMTTKGQVTIPKTVRQQLGLRQGMRVAFVVEGDHAVLRQAVPERALPKSGFGMVKVTGPALPPDFDVATLLKPLPMSLLTSVKRKAPKTAESAVKRKVKP